MATPAQIEEVQTAYFAINRTELNSTVANATADAIANGSTTLEAYIASQLAANVSTTQAAVAISAFVTGETPTAEKLNELKVAADAQVASYTAMGVANPQLGAFEAFGKGFASTTDFTTKYGALSNADFINAVYTSVYGTQPTAAAFANLSAQLTYFTTIYTAAGLSDVANQAKGAVLGQIVGYAFIDPAASAIATLDNSVATFLTAAANGDETGYGAALPAGGNPGTTFTLTADQDALVGTAANDTFQGILGGADNGFTPFDTVNGSTGVDTFNVIVEANVAVPGTVSIEGVEIINLDQTAAQVANLTSSSFEGATQVWQIGDAGNISVGAGVIAGFRDTAVNDTVTVQDGVTSASVALDGVTTGSNVFFDEATAADLVSVSVTGSVAGAGALTLIDNTGTATSLSLGITSDSAITVASFVAAETLDASTSTGDLTLDVSALVALETFTGGTGADAVTASNAGLTAAAVSYSVGAGNDVFTFNGTGNAAETTVSVTLGAGNDTFVVATALTNITTAADFETDLITITDFDGATDVLNLTALGARDILDNTELSNVKAEATLEDAIALAAAATTVGAFSIFEFGTDAYVFNNVAGAGFENGDGLIKLTGANLADFTASSLLV